MNQAIGRFRPFTNKATIVLLILVMASFGIFAETIKPARCSVGEAPAQIELMY